MLNKLKLYSFSKQDLIILLSVYNATYILLSSIVKSHFIACLVLAVLLSLVTLFIIAWIDLVHKEKEEKIKSEYEQELVRKKIKNEYMKVHKVKQKNELLNRVGCLPPEQLEEIIVADHGDPPFSLDKDLGNVKEVRFDYLDKILSREKNRGQPEGT